MERASDEWLSLGHVPTPGPIGYAQGAQVGGMTWWCALPWEPRGNSQRRKLMHSLALHYKLPPSVLCEIESFGGLLVTNVSTCSFLDGGIAGTKEETGNPSHPLNRFSPCATQQIFTALGFVIARNQLTN